MVAKRTSMTVFAITLAVSLAACSGYAEAVGEVAKTSTSTPAIVTTTPKPTVATVAGYTAYVSSAGLKVRETGSTSAKLVAQLKQGEAVTVLEKGTAWSKVKLADGKVAYVAAKFLTTTKPTPAPTVRPAPTAAAALTAVNKTGYVATKSITVRQSASTSAKVLATLKQKIAVTVLETQGAWSKIKLSNGTVGYVSKTAVIVPQRAPKPEDWSYINPVLPKVLYEYDYNINSDLSGGNVNSFRNNKQNVEVLDKKFAERGQPFDDIDAIMNAAIAFKKVDDTVDYRTIGDEYRKQQLFFAHPSSNADIRIDKWIERVKRERIVSESHFITDRSLVYGASNGADRVRGRMYIRYDAASSKDFIKGRGVEAGVWYYQDIEVEFTGIIGNNRWDHGSFGFMQTVRLSDMLPAPLAEVEGF